MATKQTRRDLAALLIALLLAYAYVLPRWADWSQNSRLNLTRALVELGTTRIDAYVHNTGDYALYKGHAYTDKAPGPSLMAVPIYAAALPIIDHPAVATRLERVAGGGALSGTLNPEGSGLNSDKVRSFVAQVLLTGAVVALPAALATLVLERLLAGMRVGRGPRLLVALAYGLATPAATYAGNFYSHSLVASLCLGAAALIFWMSAGQGGPTRALLAGLLLGFAVISEYPAAIIVAAIGLYALFRLPLGRVAWIVAGGLLPLVLLVVYDLVAFGTPIPVGYSHSALWQDQHHTGFMSISYPHFEALWGLTFGSFRGLFVRAPWLLLALPGALLWWREGQHRAELMTVVAATAGLILFYASSVMWWGGFGAGPRYIVPTIPLLALLAAPAVVWLWQRVWGRALSIGLALISLGLTWVEATAGQQFPPDSIRATWTGYVLPEWAAGNIARNVGTVLGLPGPLSLLPLLLALAAIVAFLALPARTVRPSAEPVSGAAASQQI